MRIEVPCSATPQPRHQVAMRGGVANAYIPKESRVHAYKATVRMAWQAATNAAPLDGPLHVTITAIFERTSRLIWKRKPMPREVHTGPKDCDNIAKSTQDALNGIAWKDDKQIVRLVVEKWVAAGDEQPRVILEVTEATR